MRSHTIPALHPRTTDEPRVDLQLYRIAHRSMQKGAHDVAALADNLRRGRRRLTRRGHAEDRPGAAHFAALFVLLRYLLNDAESGSAVAMRVLASTLRRGRPRPSAGTSCVLVGRISDADDS